ncbi:MAG: hypothetical protein K2W96_00055 [Gemmataceae bacterium]|nr:hypothetical protein [Gemmataceae bacterium]
MDEILRASILARLNREGRAATYGALAALVGGIAQAVMVGLLIAPPNSWIVAANNSLPTGYEVAQYDPRLLSSIATNGVLNTGTALNQWLANNP